MIDEKEEFIAKITRGLQRRKIDREEAARREKRMMNEAREARNDHIAKAVRRKHLKNPSRR